MSQSISKLEIRKTVRVRILEGQSYAAIYEDLLRQFPQRAYDLAKIVADIPSLAQRKQYGLLNWILLGCLLVFTVAKAVLAVQLRQETADDEYFRIQLFLPMLSFSAMVAIYFWERRAYPGVTLLVLWGMFQMIRPYANHGYQWPMGIEFVFYVAIIFLSNYVRAHIGGRYQRGGTAKTLPDGRVETHQTIQWLN